MTDKPDGWIEATPAAQEQLSRLRRPADNTLQELRSRIEKLEQAPKPGIYHIGVISIVVLSDKVLGVGVNAPGPSILPEAEQARFKTEVQRMFPEVEHVIMSRGDVSYESLMESPELREVIKSVVAEIAPELYDALKQEKRRHGDS